MSAGLLGHPLCEAAGSASLDFIRFLLTKGASAKKADVFGYTPLHRAAVRCRTDVIQLFLKHGADVNAIDDDKFTPLDKAMKNHGPKKQKDAAIAALLKAGAKTAAELGK